jgi:hypothetical protein
MEVGMAELRTLQVGFGVIGSGQDQFTALYERQQSVENIAKKICLQETLRM